MSIIDNKGKRKEAQKELVGLVRSLLSRVEPLVILEREGKGREKRRQAAIYTPTEAPGASMASRHKANQGR